MKKAGFTLLETLTVLLITSIIFMVGIQVKSIQTDNYELRFFVKEFMSEIENAQNKAVVTGRGVIVERKKENGETIYYFSQDDSIKMGTQKRLVLPSSVTATNFSSFWIKSHTGYIPPSTVNFWNNHLNIRISFQFGLGRMEVEETKK
ncbi:MULTISPECIES: prepilin-type N-terminal cleavage/methylation domain-containing protein [unclassified Jeotgalibaca]|uniref:prepilin-type N-terminal cleavage/methylation domain-containing protein n=1 Tax=unclassified Jeotgalibaca TaxID=2621505 RepID=UPI003FD24437